MAATTTAAPVVTTATEGMNMKALVTGCVLAIISVSVFAQGTRSTSGYIRKDGTYVQPHTSTAPNSTKSDNWSTKGNVNPYTGKAGTKKDD